MDNGAISGHDLATEKKVLALRKQFPVNVQEQEENASERCASLGGERTDALSLCGIHATHSQYRSRELEPASPPPDQPFESGCRMYCSSSICDIPWNLSPLLPAVSHRSAPPPPCDWQVRYGPLACHVFVLLLAKPPCGCGLHTAPLGHPQGPPRRTSDPTPDDFVAVRRVHIFTTQRSTFCFLLN